MKKQLKNTLAVALSLLFVLSCFVLPVSAVVPMYGQEGGYLAIGDSIGRGCGADGSYLDENNQPATDENGVKAKFVDGVLINNPKPGGQYDMYELRNVKGSYTTQIAEALGCAMPDDITDQNATFWPLCYPGLTTAMVLDVMGVADPFALESNFSDNDLNYPYYDDVLRYFGYQDSFDGVRPEHSKAAVGNLGKCGSVKTLAEKASLITVEIGMCDVFYRTYRICSKGGMLSENAEFDLSSPTAIATLVATAGSQMYTGFKHWETYYPVLIQTLLDWNPNATIVMVGSFNLVNQLTISDKIPVPLGDLFTSFTDMMNKKYKEWNKQFGDRVLFADIRNTQPKAVEKEWSLLGEFMDNTFAGTHPSQSGYDYITRRILNVLDPDKDVTTDIIVDLGRFNKADYVFVDGKKINDNDYQMMENVLVIPYNGRGAKSLTVGVKGEDGAVAAQSYQLKYSADEGYVATLLVESNDVTKPARPFLEKLKAFFQQIIDFFKGLFK